MYRENRLRFPLEIIQEVRSIVPREVVLDLRISGTEWSPLGEKNENGEWISWGIEQSKVSRPSNSHSSHDKELNGKRERFTGFR